MLDRFFKLFKKEEQKETKKTFDDVKRAIKPIFEEIAPETKAGEYLEQIKSWTFIALNAVADEIAQSELKLFKKTKDGIEEITEHPALDIIYNPNEINTKNGLLWLWTMYLGTEGEAPNLIDSSKNPTQILLLRPERIKPVYGGENKIIKSYRYQKSDGSFVEYPEEEVIFLRHDDLQNPFRGSGILKYITRTFDLDDTIEKYQNNFFYNNAMPRGVLETDSELNDNIIKRLKSQWERRHRGVDKAHKIAILEKGLKFKNTTFSLKDLTINELHDDIRDKILAAYKVPKSVLGIIDDVNRASSQTADNAFARRSIKPRLRMLEEQLNKFLLPKFTGTEGMYYKFEDPVMEDLKIKAEINDIYLRNGVLLVDEVREEIGLEPLNKEPEKEKPEKEKPEKILKDILVRLEPKKDFSPREIEDYHNKKVRFTDREEDKLNEDLRKYFEGLNVRVLRDIEEKAVFENEDVKVNYDTEVEAEMIAKIIVPYLLVTIEKQSKLTYAFMGMDDKLTADFEIVKEFADNRSFLAGSKISDTTKKDIKRIFKEWAKRKEPIRELRDRLNIYFKNAQKSRVEKIVRTEISKAAGFATRQVYDEVGVVGYRWITAKDERVCQFCKEMDGRAIPAGRNFFNKNEIFIGSNFGRLKFKLGAVKHYPLHVSCRCDIIPVWEKKELPKNPFKYKEESKEREKIRKERLKKRMVLEKEKERIIKKLQEKEKLIERKEKQVDKQIKELEDLKNKFQNEQI